MSSTLSKTPDFVFQWPVLFIILFLILSSKEVVQGNRGIRKLQDRWTHARDGVSAQIRKSQPLSLSHLYFQSLQSLKNLLLRRVIQKDRHFIWVHEQLTSEEKS